MVYDGGSGLHGCSVLYDAYDPDPARRYKLCGMLDVGRPQADPDWLGVDMAFSADGVDWRRSPQGRIAEQTSDALNKLVYNPLLGEYALLHRSAHADRRVSLRLSRDLAQWTPPSVILHPGTRYDDGATGMQYYGMTAKYMDGVFYGLLWQFRTRLQGDDFSRKLGYMEPELVYSHDGREYVPTTGRALMERPLPPAPGCAGLSPQDICESADGREYYILCSGWRYAHADFATEPRLREMGVALPEGGGSPVYRIRRDGFCALESVEPGGLVITKGLELLGDDLSFNLRADLGVVRFGLMDLSGRWLEGFSLDDCLPLGGVNDLDARPAWRGHALREVLGRRLRVAVELNNAMLHAVTATARPSIRQRQHSFADPQGEG